MAEAWGENDKPAPVDTNWGSGDKEVRTETPARGLKGWAGDIAGAALRGAVAVPETVVGLADIPTGGAVGQFLENKDGMVGFRPKQAKEAISEALDSEATKEQNRQFQEADGILEKAKVAIQNPSMVGRAVIESAPSIGSGGVVARGLMGATRLGQMGAAGAAIAGAAGEGVVGAGSAAEQIRQETEDGRLTPAQAGLAGLSGAVTGVIGAASGGLQRKLGLGDVDTMVAQGAQGIARQNASDAATAAVNPLVAQQAKSIPSSVIQGALTEGLLEELPQSLSEQLLQNLALGKEWSTDLDAAAVMGVLTGGAMGAGAAGYSAITRPNAPAQSAGAQTTEPQAPAPTGPAPALPAPVIDVAGDGTARTAADRNARLSRIASGEVTDVTPIQRPSEAMGLDPAAGPMSAAAALAVDTGVAGGMQQAAQAAELQSAFDRDEQAALKARADTPVIDYADLDEADRRYVDSYFDQLDKDTDKFLSMAMEDDDGIPDFGDPSTTSDEDFLRSMGANDQEIQDAIQTASRARVAQEGARGDAAPARDDAGRPQEGVGQAQATQAQGVSNGPQASQAQQESTKQPQGGTAQTAAGSSQGKSQPASTAAAGSRPAPAGAPAVRALTDGSPSTANAGAQAAPAPGAQGAPDSGRRAAAGAAWTRMPTTERQALADRLADQLPNVAQRKNLHRLSWDTMNSSLQRKITNEISPANVAPALDQQAPGATENVASNSTGQDEKARWLKSVADMNRMSGQFGAQIDGVTNGRLSVVGNPNATKQGRALMAAVDEARRAGATNEEIAAAAIGASASSAPVATNTVAQNQARGLVKSKGGALKAELGEKGAGTYAEKLSQRLDDARYKLMQQEALGARSSDVPALRAEVQRLENLGDEAKALDAAEVKADATRGMLKSARQELDASGMNDEQKKVVAEKARATGDAGAAAEEVFKAVDAAAAEAAMSPENDRPEPTEAQREAGNYKKGHVVINGLDISIETPAGTRRRPEWPPLQDHYGYFKGTVGVDKDHVDVFLTDRAEDTSLPVFVVDQNKRDGSLDEHKVIMGAATEEEARATYLRNYAKGWTGLGGITQMTQDEFKAWVFDSAKTKKRAALDQQAQSATKNVADDKVQAVLESRRKNGASGQNGEDAAQIRAASTQAAADPSADRWNSSTPAQREAILLAAGWKAGSPATTTLKGQDWAGFNAAQRRRLTAGMENTPQGGASTAPATPATAVAPAETGKPATPAPGTGETGPTLREKEKSTPKKNASDLLRDRIAADTAKAGGKIIGKNADGLDIREDENGVRSISRDGVRVQEAVEMRPMRSPTGGVTYGMARTELKPEFMTEAERAEASPAPEPPKSPTKAKKPSAERVRAQADVMAALADLGDILGKGTRMNIVPEQEQKLLPVLTRLLDAAFRLGYHKFKDSAKFALDQIRANLGDEAADALTLDHLQGAYIGMAGGKKGADTKRAVIDVETKAEIESHEAVQEQDDDEPAARPVEGPGVPALAGEQPADGGTPAQVGTVADAAGPGGPIDGIADADAARGGAVAPGSVGAGPANPVPAPGAKRGRGDGAGRGGRAVRGDSTNAGQPADARRESAVGEGPGDNPAPNAPAQHAPQFTPTDFTITEDFALGEGGEKTKYQANVAAIRLLQELDAAGRLATPEEQKVLARYVGWGGLANAFEGGNPSWGREQTEMKALLSPEDYAAAARSTRYAHYTSREIIQDGIYAALERFGFTGGKVLEGGAGVGNFIGLMPDGMRTAGRVTAVEREPIAAGIARHLYPQQNVVREDFTRFAGTDDYYDAAVGNPPFASDPQTDQSGRKHLNGLTLHNYFFAKEVDMLREGGILAQVITNGFLDAKGDTARRYISDRTKFLGAIRLPNNAFSKNAGTEVTTDLIFLQKRPESEWGGRAARAEAKAWLDIGTHQDKNGRAVALNQYFIDHPEMMLGDFGAFGTMYRPGMTALVARDGQDTAALLKEAVARLPEGVYQSAAVQGTEKQVNAAIVALRNPPVTEGGFFEEDGKLIRRESDMGGEARGTVITPETQWTEKTKLGEAGFAKIQGMSRMRTTLRSLIAAEMSNDDAGMGKLRAQLNQQYDEFTAAHGLINDKANARVFDDDPDYPLLASLEHSYTPAIGAAAAKAAGIKPVKSSATKAPIFARRVVAERKAVTKVESPADALAVSMAERGRLDTTYIGQLLGQDPEDALHTLTTGEKPLLFKDPATGEFVLRDAYLSGNVRAKLETAKQAGMFGNVKALEAVQPADVGAHEIVARVGSPWVPESVYEDFAKELFGDGTTASVRYTKANSSYAAYVRPGNAVADTNTWGTPSYSGTELLAALLNNRQIKVLREGPNKTRVVDVEATEAASIKAQDIRNKFSDWLFTDGDRAELLVRAYNDTNNNYVVRQYDGSFMQFPGKVPDDVIRFRRHQRNAISRIVQDRTALLDHEVGAGKTFTVIAGMMELKRTGLANKPMVIVPNHLVKQWAADWYRLYPGANILTATKKDFEKDNRRRFLAKIATGDWDAVIMAHSSFGFIKPAPEFEAQFNEKQIALVVDAINSVEDGDGDASTKKRTVKQLEGLKERLENRIKNLRNKPMDALLDFEQLGVDQIAVDEAHMFKNLMFSTKLQNVQGLGDSSGSQRAYDLYVKANQLYAKNGRGQGVVFATGTPVSNSLAEMYHMMRYLMPAQMEELGFQSFDAWANTFASVEQVWMQKPSGDGFKASNRMSNFVNTPELLHMFDQVSDTVTMADIKAAYSEENDGKEFPIPPLATGRRQPVSLKKSPAQEAYMEVLAERARAVEERKGPPKKGEDNVLVIMADGRKAAMDIRLVDLDATQREVGGRIDRAADNAMERYRKYDHVKGTQLFFSDMGTPLKHAKNELKEYEALQARIDAVDEDTRAMASLGNEAAQERVDDADAAQAEMDSKGPDWLDAVKAALRGFSVYDDLKAALIERGVPEREIAFIHDYNTDEQKASLFRKVNAGDIRFVIGSTQKMGAGTNVQERLVALHHLDVPWRPSDIEQREGRIIRQGNELLNQIPGFEVEVLAYVTQDTLDMRMWQVQETKLKMINQLRTRQIAREIDNAFEEMEMSASEMQAAATGNPDLLTEIQLKSEVKRLENRKRSFDAQQSDLQSRRKRNKRELEELPVKIERARGAAAKAQAYVQGLESRFDGWKATIDGKEYTTPADASRYLQETLEAAREPSTEEGKPGKALPIRIVLNGEAYTSRTNLADAFKELTGDRFPILWEVDGKRLIERSKIATAIRSNIADAVAEQSTKPIGTIGGFAVTVEPGRDKFNNLVLDIVATNGDDQLTGEITVGALGRGGEPDAATVYLSGERVIQKVEGMLEGAMSELRWNESTLERAKKTAKELEAINDAGGWPDAQKLEEARQKHRAVLDRLAKTQKPAKPATPAADTGEDFAASSGERVGTPTDRAVMGLARAGASGQDVLKLIAGTSRNMQNRRLAEALVKSGIKPKVVMGGDLGGGDGFRYIAKYSNGSDTITMTENALGQAEQIFLHESVHAATVQALGRPGVASLQINALYKHVAAQQGAASQYGMTNVREFIAEAFTNPEFQAALKAMPAPRGNALRNAWDALVRIVRDLLGLTIDPTPGNTVLDEVMRAGPALMRENAESTGRGSADADVSFFGAAEVRDVKDKGINYLNQVLTHEGKVSAWDKTVGTMRNLAERNPLFKPVFEAAQRFIDDVAMLANDAADFAPRLLPRVETVGDIFGKNRKNPISAEDNKAVARPLFEGTLMWARDVDGKAVLVDDLTKKYQNLPTADKAQLLLRAGRLDPNVLRMWQGLPLDQFDNIINSRFDSKMLKPGVVWSDKELVDIFGAKPNQISLYREARAGIDRSLDMTMRTDMLRLLGQDYAAMRDAVLEVPTIADARDLLTDVLMAEARENPDQAERLMKLNNDVVTRYERATELMAEGYAPLQRFGRYTVDVVDKDGERLYFGMFESARESNIMRMRMVEQYPGATVKAGTMSDQAYKLFAGVTPESLERFGEMLGLDATGDQAKDKAFQAYLQLAKNNHTALKRLIHRKGIAGFSEDVGRVMASFIYSNARLGAGGLNAGTMENAIQAIPKEQGELKDVAMGLRSYIQDPQEEGQAIRGMLFAQYLGGSLASAFVNTTQPFAVTLPWLSQFGGIKKAGAQMARAMRDMGTKGFKYDPELDNALKHAEDDGVVSPQEIHQLMAQARGTGSLRSGDGTKLGDARAEAGNYWEKLKILWGQPFALAEQFNRRSTFIAAFRLAKQEGMKNPAGFARRAVLETQFLYSKANKPKWARGAIGGTLMTFKTYSISYLEMLNRTWNAGEPGSPERAAGRRAVGWAVAMLLLMGGAGGLPFMEDLEDLIDGAAQLMGYNFSTALARKQFLKDVFGKEIGEFITSGVSGLPGAPIDVSGRLGMGNLIPGTGLLLSKPSRERDLLEIAGPAGDLVARGFGAARKVLTGDVGGAALEVAPTAVRNAAKGIDMATSDIYKDTKGYKVIDTTLDEALAKAIGFQPRSVAQVQEANSFMQRSKSFYTQTSSDIKAQWAKALFEKDEAAVERVRERLADWNRNNPEQPIVVRMPDVWKKVREMGKDRTQRIAETAPRALRQQMADMARNDN